MRHITALIVILTMALVIPVLAQPTLQVGSQAPDFNLKDQFGKTWSLSGLGGTVTILVAANSDSGRMMGPWVDGLKARYANKPVQIVGLLDLHTVPGIGRGIARSRIKKETTDPMMLDFNGSVGKAYDVSAKYPVIVVIDKGGVVKAAAKTTYSQASFAQIVKAVDTALVAKPNQ